MRGPTSETARAYRAISCSYTLRLLLRFIAAGATGEQHVADAL